MSKALLLDTNILLDAAMGERPGWAAATLLRDEIAYGGATGYVSASSLKDVYYVLTKYANESAACAYVEAALDAFTILGVDEGICRLALRSNEPGFEDGLIRACAESVPVDFIISRDEKAFRKSTIRRLSAQDYLDLFCEVKEVSLRESDTA